MLHEFLIPLVTLVCCAVGGIAGLDRLCLFHQTYQSMVSKLESERWLLDQCSDPHFFSKMHQHSDLCFQVVFLMFLDEPVSVIFLLICFSRCRSRTTRGSGPSCSP